MNSSYANLFEVELQILRKYNNYRSMDTKDNNMRELLAQARAIHFAMRNGQITYKEAQRRVEPILLRVNNHVDQIAKRCGVSPKHIHFYDLGRGL